MYVHVRPPAKSRRASPRAVDDAGGRPRQLDITGASRHGKTPW